MTDELGWVIKCNRQQVNVTHYLHLGIMPKGGAGSTPDWT